MPYFPFISATLVYMCTLATVGLINMLHKLHFFEDLRVLCLMAVVFCNSYLGTYIYIRKENDTIFQRFYSTNPQF